jgi:hypothetical protein
MTGSVTSALFEISTKGIGWEKGHLLPIRLQPGLAQSIEEEVGIRWILIRHCFDKKLQ